MNEIKIYTLRIISIFILLLLLKHPLSQTTWQQTNGPEGGTACSFICSPGGPVFAASNLGGLYKSTNEGADWTELNFPMQRVYCLLAAPNGTIFAAGGEIIFSILASQQGMLRSDDNGETWYNVINTRGKEISCLKILQNGYIFAGVKSNPYSQQPGGAYRSTDGGTTWVFQKLETEYIAFDGIISLNFDNNNVIYAASEKEIGIYRSNDYGEHWSLVSTFAPDVISVNKTNGHLFAAKKPSGVYRSTDKGSSWVPVSLEYFNNVTTIEIDIWGRIYAGTKSGIFYSTDNGSTWKAPASVFPEHNVKTITAMDNGTVYAGLSNVFACKSTDYGTNWTGISKGVFKSFISEIEFDSENNIYAIGNGCGFSISSNNGDTWLLNTILDFTPSKFLVNTNDHLFAVYENFMFRSTNKGNSWTKINSGISSKIITCFSHDAQGYLYISYQNSGIYKSTDDGNNFTYTGFSGSTINSMCFNLSGDIFLTVQGPYGGTYKSSDNGTIWTQIPSTSIDPVFIQINPSGHMFINDRKRGLIRSVNNGASWTYIQSGIPGKVSSMIINRTGDIYISVLSDELEMYLSTTNGDTWEKQTDNFPKNIKMSPMAVNSDGYIFFGLMNPYSLGETGIGVWKSAYNTVTNTVSGQVKYADNNQAVNTGYVKALFYNRSTDEVLTTDSAGILPGGFYVLPRCPMDSLFIMVYQNDEEFDNFVPTHYPSTLDWKYAVRVYPNQNLSNIDVGVFRITNGQQNQYSIIGNVYRGHFESMAGIKDAVLYVKAGNDYKSFGISKVSGSYITPNLAPGNYSVTVNRIGYDGSTKNVEINDGDIYNINFYLTNSLIGIHNISEKIPESYRLYQNYPNPFNPSTKIKFDLPVTGMVTLSVFDILGREVEVIINEIIKAGSYEINFDAGSLSSGIYFYRIETNGYIKSCKMVLLK